MKTKREKLDLIRSKPGLIDGHTHVGVLYRNYINFAYPYCLSFEDLIFRMDHFGVDHAIVFGIDSSYYTTKKGDASVVEVNQDFSTFPYEIENQNLLKEIYEIFPDHSDRVMPFLLFDPSRKTEEQAEHLDALCDQYPVFGVKTIPTYIQAFATDLHLVGKPIFDLIKRRGLPITFHCSYHKQDPWSDVFEIIKYAERHPDVRICLAHTARFVKEILDRAAKLPNCHVDLSAFPIHCDLAEKNSPSIPPKGERFEADYANPTKALRQYAEAYPDTLIWGTDAPYNYFIQKVYQADGKVNETVLKSPFKREFDILGALSDDLKMKIVHENTLRYIGGE